MKKFEKINPYGIGANMSIKLMNSRLGNLDLPPKYHADTVENANLMASELAIHGGFPQQERMVKDKRKSLDKATLYSYQAARIKKVQDKDLSDIDYSTFPESRALINPDKTKFDYDDKILSIGFEHGYVPGDVFEWRRTNSYWLITLQDVDEIAYFRGEIRRCDYTITWLDDDGNQITSYAAIRGPVETKINFIQKHGVSVDTPNHSLSILLPKNDYTVDYFTRYKKFYLQGDKTCWRVEATDWISTPGILEVIAVEYYANETEDNIEEGIVGGLLEQIKDPNDSNISAKTIVGETFIRVKKSCEFFYEGNEEALWNVDKKYPVKLTIDPEDGKKVTVYWDSSFSGQFELHYGDIANKTIIVESLF